MFSPSLSDLLAQVIEVVEHAGALLAAEWNRPEGPRGGDDKAAIDVDIERFLRPALLHLFKCDFWGEETGHVLTGHAWCWVVDPNDGTSDFLKGLKGSAISVGLLHNCMPVLWVVYAPVTFEGRPDCIGWAQGNPHLTRNGRALSVRLEDQQLSSHSTIMVSAAAVTQPDLNRELCAPGRFHAMPSIAYRLARVAAGDGICGLSLYPVSAHDVVAGHALLKGAGGVLLDENGTAIGYATEAKMATVSQRCFGGSPAACRELMTREWVACWAGRTPRIVSPTSDCQKVSTAGALPVAVMATLSVAIPRRTRRRSQEESPKDRSHIHPIWSSTPFIRLHRPIQELEEHGELA